MMYVSKDEVKRHLVSAAITFTATFLFFFCGLIMQDNFNFSWDAAYAASLGAFIAAARAVAKIIYEWMYEILSSSK